MRDYVEADELRHKVLALDLRHLGAHALLGELYLSTFPTSMRDYVEADELRHKVLALDLRHLGAHALLGELYLSTFPTQALHHFELGVAISSVSVGEDFDGIVP